MVTQKLTRFAKSVIGKGFSPRNVSASTRQFAATASPGPVYLGFDTKYYPGDDVMQNWFHTAGYAPFYFCGFYLHPAPNTVNPPFWTAANRSFMQSIGWGFLITYYGYQNLDTAPNPPTTQGQIDGNQAVQDAQSAGFAYGSLIYLDREATSGPNLNTDQLTYIQSWANTVAGSGYYAPAIYCHYKNANQIKSNISNLVRYWVTNINIPPSAGCTVDPSGLSGLTPSSCTIDFATTWQYALSPSGIECAFDFGGVPTSGPLGVDLDMSIYQNPSAP